MLIFNFQSQNKIISTLSIQLVENYVYRWKWFWRNENGLLGFWDLVWIFTYKSICIGVMRLL